MFYIKSIADGAFLAQFSDFGTSGRRSSASPDPNFVSDNPFSTRGKNVKITQIRVCSKMWSLFLGVRGKG